MAKVIDRLLTEIEKEEMNQRETAFKEYIQQGCKAFNCELLPKVVLVGQNISTEISIKSFPPPPVPEGSSKPRELAAVRRKTSKKKTTKKKK